LDLDRDVMRLLDEAAVSFGLVLTKSDKLAPENLAATLAVVGDEARRHTAAFPEISATSVLRGVGLDPLKEQLAALAEH
jgi:GTP-binding protein